MSGKINAWRAYNLFGSVRCNLECGRALESRENEFCLLFGGIRRVELKVNLVQPSDHVSWVRLCPRNLPIRVIDQGQIGLLDKSTVDTREQHENS